MTNGKAAGQTPSSEEVEEKKKNASKKGTVVSQTVVSQTVSKIPKISKISKIPKISLKKLPVTAIKSVINEKAVPKFNDKGLCCRCKSNDMISESIACQVCNDNFHACCKDKFGHLSSKSICSSSFLKMVLPVIAKYGTTYSQRFGDFGWTCPNCKKKALLADNKTTVETADSTCNTSMDSINSVDYNESVANEKSCEKTLAETFGEFKANLLSSVEELISDKLKSHVDSLLTDVPKLTRRSSTPSSASSIPSSASALALQQSSPLGACPRPDSSLSSSKSYSSALCPESIIESSTTTDSYIELTKMETPMTTLPSNIIPDNAPENHVIVLDVAPSNINLEEAGKLAGNALDKIPVIFLTPKPNTSKIVISFPSEKDRENGKMALANASALISSKVTVNDAKKMFPKVTVTNIPNNLISHIISERLSVPEFREKVKAFMEVKLLEKNQAVKDLVTNHNRTFKVVYVNCGRNYTTVGIKVSPDIRHLLLKNQTIYIGNSRCKVSDRFDLKQCFRCQKLGHISSHCQDTAVICMYCSASHKTRDCPDKEDREKHRCTNCSHSSNDSHRDSCSTHHSGAENCPIIRLEKESLRQRTEYSKNM